MTGHDAEPRAMQVVHDAMQWPVGTAAEVAWIAAGTTVDRTITSAIPAVFEAYCTVVLPEGGNGQDSHDEALLSVLRAHSVDAQWWLGYLETGADDVVFPEAPRTTLYSGWSYVLVQAGPEQAATWRRWDLGRGRAGVEGGLDAVVAHGGCSHSARTRAARSSVWRPGSQR